MTDIIAYTPRSTQPPTDGASPDVRVRVEQALMRFNRGDDDITDENLPSAYERAAASAILAALASPAPEQTDETQLTQGGEQ